MAARVARILAAVGALAMLAGCGGARLAAHRGATGRIHIAGSRAGRADGVPVSLTLVPKARFPSYVLTGEQLYRLYYWSDGRRDEAFLEVPAGVGPEADGGFPLIVDLHGGAIVAAPVHVNGFPTVTEKNAGSYAWAQDVVFLPNYRGYGGSPGTVGSAYDCYVDAANALKALGHLSGLHIAPDQTYLWGSSLGGFVALRLAAEDPNVKAMVLDSPYPGARIAMQWLTSQPAGDLSAFDQGLETSLMQSFGLDTQTAAWARQSVDVQDVATPTLVIAGTEDRRLPPSMERLLYAQLKAVNPADQLNFFKAGHAPSTSAAQGDGLAWLLTHGAMAQ